MYLIFAASVLLSLLGLLSFVLVLLLVLPSWLLCLVRCGFLGSLVIRHEIRINSNLPGLLSGFSWLLVPVMILCPVCCCRAVVVLLSQDLTGLQGDGVTV